MANKKVAKIFSEISENPRVPIDYQDPTILAEMLKQQNNSCAICQSSNPGGKHRQGMFMVDHNHKTGKIRGLLCNRCNLAIGVLRDDVKLLNKVVQYLHSTTPP